MNLDEIINFNINIKNKKYIYNNKYIPRVTEILSEMDNPDYFNKWANHLGFKHISYKKELDYLASIGTYVHEMNEMYINSINLENCNIPFNMIDKVTNAHNSFKLWYNNLISNNNVRILDTEKELTCEYYGGTCDLLLEINGRIYLVDYKTSNNLSYKHFIQLSAYINILNNDGFDISGCIILQLSKESNSYNEYILNFDIFEHREYIKKCFSTFEYLLCGYYMKSNLIDNHNMLFKKEK